MLHFMLAKTVTVLMAVWLKATHLARKIGAKSQVYLLVLATCTSTNNLASRRMPSLRIQSKTGVSSKSNSKERPRSRRLKSNTWAVWAIRGITCPNWDTQALTIMRMKWLLQSSQKPRSTFWTLLKTRDSLQAKPCSNLLKIWCRELWRRPVCQDMLSRSWSRKFRWKRSWGKRKRPFWWIENKIFSIRYQTAKL